MHVIYKGFTRGDGTRYVSMFEIFTTHTNVGDLDPRQDLFNHSPTGFEWGYHGSGPAQLALAILADHLHRLLWPAPAGFKVEDIDALAISLHQEFKKDVIAGIPQSEKEWRILASQVTSWLWRNDRATTIFRQWWHDSLHYATVEAMAKAAEKRGPDVGE